MLNNKVFTLLVIQVTTLSFLGQAFMPHSKNAYTKQQSSAGTDFTTLQRNSATMEQKVGSSSSSSSSSSTTLLWSSSFATKFEFLQSLESRLEVLERGAPAALTSFYEPGLKSFSIKPGSVEVGFSHAYFVYVCLRIVAKRMNE